MNNKTFLSGLAICVAAAAGAYCIFERWGPTRRIDLDQINSKLQNLGDQPVALDFYADWCSPCRMQAPVVEAAEKQWEGQLKFIRINVDSDNWALAKSFGIHGIPSIVLIDPKTKIGTVETGYMDEEHLNTFIHDVLHINPSR